MQKINLVDRHRNIIQMIRHWRESNECITVSKLAIKTGHDSRTVRKHLEIAEIDGFGHFTDSDKTIFCMLKLKV